jgi:hypothetical protein
VAQLNLYVPDEIAAKLRSGAESEGKSLSSFVVDKFILPSFEQKLFGPEFWRRMDELGPLPDDFVAPPRELDPDLDWSFDDIPS